MKRVKAKKHFGQHFLTDLNVAQKIADNIPKNSNHLIEIGPGTGMLTQLIYNKHNKFTAIEIDKELVVFLNEKIPGIDIINQDFLRFNLHDFDNDDLSIVGNFPYNISSQILFKTFEFRQKVTSLVGMFQLEVGDRIAASSGSKKYGILSVLIQTFFDVHKLFVVNQHVFTPPPKVKSIVIKLTRNSRDTLGCNEGLYMKVVKAAFNKRRKMLRNALNMFTFINQDAVNDLLSKRAEQLSVQDFIRLTKVISNK